MVTDAIGDTEIEQRIKEIRMSPPIPELVGYAMWKRIMISVLKDILKRIKS